MNDMTNMVIRSIHSSFLRDLDGLFKISTPIVSVSVVVAFKPLYHGIEALLTAFKFGFVLYLCFH